MRESCCLALTDCLRGRSLVGHITDGIFTELWETLFKVQDDIKESVRKGAESALKVLSKVSFKHGNTTGFVPMMCQVYISYIVFRKACGYWIIKTARQSRGEYCSKSAP